MIEAQLEELPKVTPSLLARGLDMCPRKARYDLDGRAKTRDVFLRWRLRTPFVDAASTSHRTMRCPEERDFPVPVDLTAEEIALWIQAVAVYCERCGQEAARTEHVDELDAPMPALKRGVRIAGGVDLVVTCASGDFELRQFEFWGKPLVADPLENWVVALAVLRLARWGRGRTILLRHIDLIGDAEESSRFEFATDLAMVAERFTTRVTDLRARTAEPAARPGVDCGTCSYVAGCPAHRNV